MVLRCRVFCLCISKTFVEHFNLRSNHGVFFVHFVSIIQNGKTVKASKIFEIIAEQNHSFRSLFHVFLELQGINTVARYALFLGGATHSICHFFHPSVRLSVRRTPYLRNLTSSAHNFWYTCVK